jgi:hypothetical protein
MWWARTQERAAAPTGSSVAALTLPSKIVREADPMPDERRNISDRAAIVQRVVDGVVQNPSVTLTVNTLQQWLGVSADAAQRILQRLISSGLVREVQKGVWARGTLGSPSWY